VFSCFIYYKNVTLLSGPVFIVAGRKIRGFAVFFSRKNREIKFREISSFFASSEIKFREIVKKTFFHT